MFSSSVRSVAFSAFRAGGLRSVQLRPSRHARSGRVLVCSFASAQRARAFAGRWAQRLGVSVAVRRSYGLWAVSVPVAAGSSRLPVGFGRVIQWAGGLRGFCAALGWAGLVQGV